MWIAVSPNQFANTQHHQYSLLFSSDALHCNRIGLAEPSVYLWCCWGFFFFVIFFSSPRFSIYADSFLTLTVSQPGSDPLCFIPFFFLSFFLCWTSHLLRSISAQEVASPGAGLQLHCTSSGVFRRKEMCSPCGVNPSIKHEIHAAGIMICSVSFH